MDGHMAVPGEDLSKYSCAQHGQTQREEPTSPSTPHLLGTDGISLLAVPVWLCIREEKAGLGRLRGSTEPAELLWSRSVAVHPWDCKACSWKGAHGIDLVQQPKSTSTRASPRRVAHIPTLCHPGAVSPPLLCHPEPAPRPPRTSFCRGLTLQRTARSREGTLNEALPLGTGCCCAAGTPVSGELSNNRGSHEQ